MVYGSMNKSEGIIGAALSMYLLEVYIVVRFNAGRVKQVEVERECLFVLFAHGPSGSSIQDSAVSSIVLASHPTAAFKLQAWSCHDDKF